MWIFVFYYLIFSLATSTNSTIFSSSVETCKKNCADTNIAFPLERDQFAWSENYLQQCDYSCRVNACEVGCSNLDEAVTSCQNRCSSLEIGIDSCRQGCHQVELAFVSQVQDIITAVDILLETDPEPIVSTDEDGTPTPSPLGINAHFSFPEYVSAAAQELASTDVDWYAQSRATTKNPGWHWIPLPAEAFRNSSLAYSAVLPREVSSQISVRLAVAWHGRVIVSRPVLWSAPEQSILPQLKLENQLQLTADKYAICWGSNRNVGKFRITLSTLDGTQLQTMDTQYKCQMLQNMPKENCCRATIAQLVDGEETPISEISVKIEMISTPDANPDPAAPQLIIANGSNILLLENVNDYIITKDPQIINFQLEAEDKITAIVGISSEELLVGTERGGIWSVSVVNNNSTNPDETVEKTQKVLRDPDGSSITQLVHDPLQKMVYALLSKKGLLRCPLNPAPCTFLDTNSLIQYISVDSWNGFLYYISSEGDLVQAELFSFNATETYTFEKKKIIPDLSPAVAIEIDYSEQELIVVLQNGSVVGRNIVTGEGNLRRAGSYPGVKKMHLTNGRMLWTKLKCGDSPLDEVCFYSEEKDEETIHFSRYLYSGVLVDFSFLSEPVYPPSLLAPVPSGLVTSDTKARVTWKPPQSMPFQAMGSEWRNMRYECRLQASNTESAIEEQTTETDLVLPISPATEYTASVRACTLHICSPFANSINTAFAQMNGTPVYVMKRIGDTVSTMDVLGQAVEEDANLKGISVDNGIIVAFDNTTDTFYTAQPESQLPITRSSSFLAATNFVTSYMITYLSIIPSRSMLLVASSYQINSYRLTGTFDQIIYSCEQTVIAYCSEVVGLAGEDSTGEIFFITQAPNGTVQLFVIPKDQRTPTLMASSTDFPPIRQLIASNNKLIFITKRGHMGFVDKQLGSLNINHALTDLNVMVPVWPAPKSNRFELNPEVLIGEKTKGELNWSAVGQPDGSGSVLYKISLYKDHLGSDDRFVSASLTPSFTLPVGLLESWASGQHFDVYIEALDPWTIANVSKTGLIAPTKPPTQPGELRIYATQQKTVDGARAIITFFWSSPNEWNGNAFRYVVNCTQMDASVISVELPSTVTHYSFAVKNGKVSCAVAASNEPSNVGEFSPQISIDSSELRPLVRLFAIDSTNDLIAIPNITDGNTPKKRKRRQAPSTIQHTHMEYQAIAYIENDLYAVVKEPDTVQPTLVQLDANNISNVVHKASIGGEVSRIEAMTSDWVGYRLLFVMSKSLYQIALDPFMSSSILTPRKLIELSLGASDAKQLTFDPFKNTAYLLTRNGSLFSLNLWKGLEENLALTVPCLSSQTVTWMTTEFAWNRAASPKIYALTWNGLVEVELDGRCGDLKSIDWNKFGEKGLKAMSAFSIADKLFVFVTSAEMLIYRPDGSITPIPIKNPPVRQILAVSQSSQPYPERSCFALPASSQISFSVQNEGRTGALVKVDKPPSIMACQDISVPQTLYDMYFNRTDKSRVKHIESYNDVFHVENGTLDKETDYEVRISWHNRYSTESGISSAKTFRTGFGYPSSPQGPLAFAITPDTVFLMWLLPETLNAPIEQIKYRITQQVSSLSTPSSIAVQPWSGGGFSPSTTDVVSCLENPCRVKMANLRASTDYKFWVTAIHESHLNSQFPEDSEAVSVEATARTKDIAGTLRPDNVTGSSLLLRWNSLQPEEPPTSVSIQYKESGGYGEWKTPKNASFEPRDVKTSIGILITNLLSATSYDYRFVAVYRGNYEMNNHMFEYSEDYYQGIQQARTKAGTPTEPQSVSVRQDVEGWIVEWQPPNSDGGSPITSYAVEMRLNRTSEWEIAERGLDGRILWWRPPKADAAPHWQFRVRAANQEGFGPYREVPLHEDDLSNDERTTSWLPIVIIITLIVAVILMAATVILSRQRNSDHRTVHKIDDKSITLEQMSKFETQANHQLPPQMQNELKNLPHLPRESIRLVKKLGLGSFGEVYEGIVSSVPLLGTENVRVAVKALRQGYNAAEKLKFQKEAILMNNFDHPNIVKLLGVSFSPEPSYLIIELMEGGDLLAFLRDSRPTDTVPSQLSLRDLLGMVIDVGRGGAYLEQHRHVHRDLAARNCLITQRYSPMRVTKIADFGLARDVFTSEYYKVHGEDSLPLRWLAPESAISGVFSSKSDVWSFGILLWEIMTLGHTPYPGLDNSQALTLIKDGKHLEKPPHCPDQIFKIIQSCWAMEPSKRPTFAELLEQFQTIRENSEYQDDKPFPPSSLGHVNNAFETSLDSSSSDKDRERPTFPTITKHTQRLAESPRYAVEKSLANSPRRQPRPAVFRPQQLQENRRSNPNPFSDMDHNRTPYSLRSESNVSSEDYRFPVMPRYDTANRELGPNLKVKSGQTLAAPSSSYSGFLPQNHQRMGNRLSTVPMMSSGVDNDGYSADDSGILSHSWSGPNRGVVSEPAGSDQSTMHSSRSVPYQVMQNQHTVTPRTTPNNSLKYSPESSRKAKVSRV